MSHSLWVEKYRPKDLSTYIGNEHLKEKVKVYLESEDVPHLLLFGKAGTGKTTLAKMLVNSIDCDYLYINASDENGYWSGSGTDASLESRHCSNWTSNSNSVQGSFGEYKFSDRRLLHTGAVACNGLASLVCICF